MIAIATETLDLWGVDFSSTLGLLMPTFSLPTAPVVLANPPSAQLKCSPTTRALRRASVSSVSHLAPVHFRRSTPLSSELLHTL